MNSIAKNQPAVKASLVQRAISHRHNDTNSFIARVDVYYGMLKVEYPSDAGQSHYHKPEWSSRGTITEFTRRSRRRMMDKMQQLENPTRLLFVTLTYTDQSLHQETVTRNYHRDIDCFNKRIQSVHSGTGHIWRIEYKERLSGRFEGHTVPHFHIVLHGYLGDLGKLRQQVRQWWDQIIHDNATDAPRPRIDIQPAQNQRHAMYYISKYVAKVSDENNIADEHQHNYSDGHRHWGIVGCWETPVYVTIKLTRQELIDLRRLCVRWLKSKGSAYSRRLSRSISHQGFSIYGLGKFGELAGKQKTATIFRMLQFVTGLYDP